jgi:hypothetical protein
MKDYLLRGKRLPFTKVVIKGHSSIGRLHLEEKSHFYHHLIAQIFAKFKNK